MTNINPNADTNPNGLKPSLSLVLVLVLVPVHVDRAPWDNNTINTNHEQVNRICKGITSKINMLNYYRNMRQAMSMSMDIGMGMGGH
jgi:hypothetical protein